MGKPKYILSTNFNDLRVVKKSRKFSVLSTFWCISKFITMCIKFHILYMQMTPYTFIFNLIQKFLTVGCYERTVFQCLKIHWIETRKKFERLRITYYINVDRSKIEIRRIWMVTKNQVWPADEKRELRSLWMSSILFNTLFSFLVVIPRF